MANDARTKATRLRLGLKYPGLFLVGAVLFSYVYNIVVGFLVSLRLVTSGGIGLGEWPATYWNQWLRILVAGDDTQTAWSYFIWSTQFFLIFASPVILYAVVSLPVIYFSERPEWRARSLTVPYLCLYAANLWIVANGIASI